MTIKFTRICCILMWAYTTGLDAQGQTPAAPSRNAEPPRKTDVRAGLALTFEPNRGQTDSRVKFIGRTPLSTTYFAADGAVLSFRDSGVDPDRTHQDAVVRMRFAGSNRRSRVEALQPQTSKSNYFIGNHPTEWRTGVPRFGSIAYRDLYPGIDAVFYGNQTRLEYDLVINPGADPASIRLRFEGSRPLRIDENGDLILGTAGRSIRQQKPAIYQNLGGSRVPVEGRYVLRSKNEVGFQIARYQKNAPLIVDPVVFATYLGGNGGDSGNAIALDANGNVFITGTTSSTNFPVRNAQQPNYGGGNDVFVAKLDPTGALLWCTYLGGSSSENSGTVATDSSGAVYVTGQTTSTNFPTLSAFQTTLKGAVTPTLPNWTPMETGFLTYLGGSNVEYGFGIAVDAAGNAAISGYTASVDFPTVHPFQAVKGSSNHAFAAKLNATGTALIYSTYIGGNGQDYGNNITSTPQGDVYISGDTTSTDLPLLHAFQTTNAGGADGFVVHIDPQGNLVYSTYIGGSGGDAVRHLAVNSAGEVWITGETGSTDFPTVNAYQPTNAGGLDGYLAKISASGSTLLYSTYIGGSKADMPNDVAMDSAGNVYIAGNTTSTDFPVMGAVQFTNGGGQDGFLVKFSPAGIPLFSTYLGGSNTDVANGVAVDNNGFAHLTGTTQSTDFPVLNAVQPTNGGATDAFIAKINTCTFSVSPSSATFDSAGGTGSFLITTTPECPWTAAAGPSWITLTSAASGTGNGSIAFSVAANTTTTAQSGAITVSGQSFTINEAGSAIALSGITPASGATGTAVNVTLVGENFTVGTTASTNNPGIGVTAINVASATQITATFTIAAGATLGQASVFVSNSLATSNPVGFTVIPPPPVLSSITPSSGNNDSNIQATITGANFVAGAVASVSGPGMAVTHSSVISSTQMSVTVAVSISTNPGNYGITVSTSGGTSNTLTFTVVPPVLTGIVVSPPSVTGGVSVAANTVALSGPAPSGGVVVALTSSNPAATVPASVLVPPGATASPAFTITTSAVTSTIPVTISATYNGVTVNAPLSVTPPPVSGSPVLQLHADASEVSGTQNGAVVTPTIAPAGLTGTVVVTSGGSVNFTPAANGNGVYFLNCCSNSSNAYYKFTGTALGQCLQCEPGADHLLSEIPLFLRAAQSDCHRAALCLRRPGRQWQSSVQLYDAGEFGILALHIPGQWRNQLLLCPTRNRGHSLSAMEFCSK